MINQYCHVASGSLGGKRTYKKYFDYNFGVNFKKNFFFRFELVYVFLLTSAHT